MTIRFAVILATLATAAASAAAQTNVAFNRPVTLVTGSANGAALSTLTDALFLPRGQQWQTDTVWWSSLDVAFEIDLGGVFSLDSAIVQADDNDAYMLLYRNLDTGTFLPLWDVANFDNFGNGMQTRPNPEDNAERFAFPVPITTDAIRIAATSGDSSYSVSEVQVFTVPAPSAIALLAMGGLVAVRRRRMGS